MGEARHRLDIKRLKKQRTLAVQQQNALQPTKTFTKKQKKLNDLFEIDTKLNKARAAAAKADEEEDDEEEERHRLIIKRLKTEKNILEQQSVSLPPPKPPKK